MRRLASLMLYTATLIFFGSQVSFAQKPHSAKPAEATKTPAGSKANAALDKDSINNADMALQADTSEPSPLLIKAQVLLDREHASPGVIDGRSGDNMGKAIVAFETTNNLPLAPQLNNTLWAALTANQKAPVLVDYDITDKDVAGPYTPVIPTDYGELAKLTHLDYRNVSEMLAERFHMDERLLTALNPGADFAKAGTHILVANVATQPLKANIAKIVVDKEMGQVRAIDEQGKLIVAYPATVGSEELPSPSGDYKVKGVAWRPTYSYNPQKNFQQGNNKKKLTIGSGPNNPVGTVFIALTKPTYGIHGTPDPS